MHKKEKQPPTPTPTPTGNESRDSIWWPPSLSLILIELGEYTWSKIMDLGG
jgi:hypothetical protein